MDQSKIRNFSIVAHIDHGKSTLADRIIEFTNTLSQREMKAQILDSMELERERGITIKLNAIQLKYTSKTDGEEYTFHLIDTPGHVDFTYEVSRSLKASDGALLVVDAAQGVEAQTIANAYLAIDANLEILPVVNKIDLPAANPENAIREVEEIIGLPAEHAPLISAKSGLNIEDVLEGIVNHLPAPTGDGDKPLKALIFDSYFDSYRGAIAYIRIFDGSVKVGDKIKFMNSGAEYVVNSLGINTPGEVPKKELTAGEVGFLTASIKSVEDIKVGDTITHVNNPAEEAMEGYQEMNPMVYAGLFPIDSKQYNDLRDALEKLKLNDASLVFEAEASQALGFGFRCGFLGLLHMEVIQERIEREFNIDLIATAPSVIYKAYLTNGTEVEFANPEKMPDPQVIDRIEEPIVKATMILPNEYIGTIMQLCQDRRGVYLGQTFIDANRVSLEYNLPLSEVVFDFFDKLKSYSKGYASFDYELSGYQAAKLVKLDILVNRENVDALSIIVHKDFAYNRGNIITKKMKTIIPRQQFEIPIQASIGNAVIARETVKALRKNVLAKCYGGDISRKRKLLEKQKAGKKRMKAIGSVEIPQEAFMSVLSIDED